MREPPHTPPLRVVIAGAGVAGLETLLALRALAGKRVDVTLVAPTSEFVYRPLAVVEPFDGGQVRGYRLDRIASDLGATFVQDRISWVGVRGQIAFLDGGEELPYDALVLALGAQGIPPWPGVPVFRGPADVARVRELIGDVERGAVTSVAFVVPPGVTWPFPIYELALQTAQRASETGAELEVTLITPEHRPLDVFGREASDETGAVLAANGVHFEGGAVATVAADGAVHVKGEGGARRFDRILTLPRLEGPAPRGVPCDDDGFLPVDAHGMVIGVEHVYAAGDGTDFPVKQGGLAAQQADAVAEMIAKRAGARVDPRPLRPILRGHLIADGSSRYLRGELHHRDGGASEASETQMWWPGGKIAGTYLSPYLAQLDAEAVERRA